MGLQLRKEKAEIKVMEAQAENLKAEAKKKGGVDTEKAEWEITNLGIIASALERAEMSRCIVRNQSLTFHDSADSAARNNYIFLF